MSYYDDRRTSARTSRRRDDDYYDDSVYANTRENQRSTATAIVKRRSDSPDYDEEVRRDFSPGGGGYYRETITRKSGTRPADRARSYDNGRYDDDRSFASTRRGSNYGASRKSNYDDRDRRRQSRYDSDGSSRSRTPPRRERRKSMPEEALKAIGLGGLAATIMGKKSRSRSRSSSGGRRSNRSRSRRDRSGSPEHRKEQLQQALKAAVLAGAASAFRARKEDGGWGGEKGRRVLTAALTAGGIDGFVNRDKDPEKHSLVTTIGSALAGVATDQVVNGTPSRSQSRGPNGSPNGGRSRSRSKGRDLLAGGAIAAAAKKAADSFRGRSSSRGPRRDQSTDSYDSRSPPPKRSRSRSVLARGLSKIGLDDQADKVDPAGARQRSRSRGGGRRRSRSRSQNRYADDDYVDDRRGSSLYDPPNNFNGRGSSVYDSRDVGNSRSLNSQSGAMIGRPNSVGPGGGILSPPPPGYQYDTNPHHYGDPETDSESDLGRSTDDEKKLKHGRKRLLISGGLATVATIHAGHSVQQSYEKRQIRRQALKDGTISKEEAQQHKSRDRLQDAASLGLAGLGLKGAYSEWKELKEQADERKEEKEKHDRHARKREARRLKYNMVGMGDGYANNSAPALSTPYSDARYDGYGQQHHYDASNATYMSGANAEYRQHGPSVDAGNNAPQYFDDNPYGSMSYQQSNNNNFNGNRYGASQYPPPPGGQPPPPQ